MRFASEKSHEFFPAKRQLYGTTHFRKLRNPNEFLVKRGTSYAEESFAKEIFCLCSLYDGKTANYLFAPELDNYNRLLRQVSADIYVYLYIFPNNQKKFTCHRLFYFCVSVHTIFVIYMTITNLPKSDSKKNRYYRKIFTI